MFKLVVAVGIGLASAFNAPASMQQLTRASVSTSSNVEMFFKAGGSPKKGALQGFKGVRPLSPKSNCARHARSRGRVSGGARAASRRPERPCSDRSRCLAQLTHHEALRH